MFDEDVLDWACKEAVAALDRSVDYLIFDELGPLEAQRGQGLAPALEYCLKGRSGGSTSTAVIAVVRESIRPVTLARFGIPPDAALEIDLAGTDL